MLPSTRQYTIRFIVAMGLYLVTLPLTLWLSSLAGDSWWRFAAYLLVLPSLILIARAVWRYVAEADELQSRKIVESLAIAFAGGSILTFTWGMLEHVGAPTLPIIWAMPVYMGCWLVASLIVNRRY
ncbi:hypothetical protein [Propionimicrobium sp. PCR01-08-3]|uniref:hypothetical protein n=1 Tax=Propionimicrobium sp. PCR01-08-3 TaxID=3052086 RepID=UPI00255C9502|nr:hypothetical protein [Propionimicrobium sp. PCR01-08-3]WIY82920.1 hypothetical protein QQ658_00725 [Propionimicrobium sp. PCR01-08-3]